jgi:ATP-dependent Zn protease
MNFFDEDDDEPDMTMRMVGKRRLPTNTPSMPKPDAMQLFPQVVLEQALGKAGMARLNGSQSLCLVIETRADDWVGPMERFLRQEGDWDKTISKTSDQARRRDDAIGPEVLRILSKGGRIFGVAGRFGHLPESMVTGADIRVELPPITTEVIETVIRRMTRKRVTVPQEVARLNFSDLVSCMRVGDSAAAIVTRLERAAASVKTITPIADHVPHIRDLHGYGAAKNWAIELIEDVEAWRRGELEFSDLASRNCVLVSAPGLGKTTFVKSLAKTLGMPLVATSVGQWFSNGPGHLDSVIKQIDQTFATAAAAAPAVLLLDELDGVPDRARLSGHNSDWWVPVITHLLTTLDSAVSGVADKLIIIGATNHGDRIDSALIRPGRLDSLIHIGPPNAEALVGIMRQHLGQDLVGENLSDAANLAFGATGAHVVGWVRAARRTARNARRPMQMSDLVDVIAPADDRGGKLLERVAIHEAGHAVACHVLGLGNVLSVSIVAQGNSGGMTVSDFDGHVPTLPLLEQVVQQMLAGRAAEEIVLGQAGTGSGGSASSDLARATRTLGLKHFGAGLGQDMAFRADADGIPGLLAINDRAARAVEADLRRIYGVALEMIRANVVLVQAVADALLASRHLGPAGFLEVVERTHAPGKEPSHG